MTSKEYAAKLRHAAEVIECLGVVPISSGVESDGTAFALLRCNDFLDHGQIRIYAQYEDIDCTRHFLSVIDGVAFMANKPLKSSGKIPLGASI